MLDRRRVTHSMTRRLSFFAILLLAPSLLLGQPITVSEARQVSSLTFEPSTIPAEPVAGSDGRGFLVAWTELPRVRVARIDSAGMLLDPLGIELPVRASRAPQVVWNGTNYLVFTTKAGATVCESHHAVTAIDPLGRIVAMHTLDSGKHDPLVASNGHSVLLVNEPCSSDGTIATLLDSTGTPSSANLLQDLYSSVHVVGVGSNGAEFLIVMHWGAGLSTFHIRADGVLASTAPVPIVAFCCLNQVPTDVAVASDGDSYVVFWRDSYSDFIQFAIPIAADGSAAGAPRVIYSGLGVVAGHVQVSWNGSFYLVSGPLRRLWMLDRKGAVVKEAAPSGAGNRTSIASAGLVSLLVFADDKIVSPPRTPLQGAMLSASGDLAGPAFTVAFAPPPQSAASASFGAGEWMVVWSEPSGVFASRATPEGVPIDGRGIRIGAVPASETAVTFTGSGFLVVWSAGGVLTARPLGNDGNPIAAAVAMKADSSAYSVSVASAGHGDALVAWAGHQSIRVASIDTSGQFGSPVELTNRSGSITDGVADATVRFIGTSYAVVWQHVYYSSCRGSGTYSSVAFEGIHVNALGKPLDASPVVLASKITPALRCSGSDFGGFSWQGASGAIAWSGLPGWSTAIFDGNLHSIAERNLIASPSALTRVATDGQNFLFAWTTNTALPLATTTAGVTPVSPAGVVGPTTLFLDGIDHVEAMVDAASGEAGLALLITQRTKASGADAFVPRIVLRIATDAWDGVSRARHRATR